MLNWTRLHSFCPGLQGASGLYLHGKGQAKSIGLTYDIWELPVLAAMEEGKEVD